MKLGMRTAAAASVAAVLCRLLLLRAEADDLRAFISERDAFDAAEDARVLPSRSQPPLGWLTAYALLYAERPAKVVAPRVSRLTTHAFRLLRRAGQPFVVPFEAADDLVAAEVSLDSLRSTFPANGSQLGDWFQHISDDRPFDETSIVPVAQELGSEVSALLGVRAQPLLGLGAPSLQPPHLWLGVSSYHTPTHMDDADNLVLLLSGSKQFWISPPTSWPALQSRCVANQCWASLRNPTDTASLDEEVESAGATLTVRELLRRVQASNLTLRAGEALYLPAGWWHCVHNLGGPTVMVNVWTKGAERVAVNRHS